MADGAVLVCSSCSRECVVPEFDPSRSYLCPTCSATMTTRTKTEITTIRDVPDDKVPPEVTEARRDPTKRLGGFVLARELGRGGVGIVYQAWDEKLARWVAVKRIHPHNTEPEDLVRFRREGRMAARLDHPNIATIHEVSEHQGTHYIVMKFVDGTTLEKAGLKDVREIVRIVRDACLGVAHAHKERIVHRDLKPQNVMIDREGRVFVLDFGLAKPLDGPSLTLTGSHGYLGTPAFMAPEQARGLLKEIDTRTDVYALGATLYFALTGKFPYPGQSGPDMMVKIATEPVPAIRTVRPDVPEELEAILLKSMAKTKNDRYPTAAELAKALDGFLGEKSAIPAKASRTWVWVLLSIVAAGVVFVATRKPKPAPDDGKKLDALYAEVQTLMKEGKYDDAIRKIEELKKLDKEGRRTAELEKAMMEINTALAAVDSERKRVEKEYREKMEEGRRHLSEKNWKSAKAAFAAALRLRPGDREAGEGQEQARLAIHRNVEAMERLHVLRDHSGRVAALAYGGRTAISGGEDNHLRFWLDGRLVRKAAGHSSAVWSIAVSGARVATAGGDGRILVRDLDGAELHALSGPASGTMAVAFTRDGKRLVSGGNENPAVVWDLTTREPVRVLDRASVGAQSVALSANDRMLATSGFGAEVRLWDLESGRPLGELSGHASGPLALAFAPEGALLVSGGPDGRIGFWDASARRELRAPVDAEAPVLAVAFRPDGPFVAAAVGKSVRIYAPSSGALVRTLEGHGDAVRALAWSADGTELASGDEAGVIHVWGVKE